jgi:predicted carbohydrate-binding protein with CBM5 and CBM33 domain
VLLLVILLPAMMIAIATMRAPGASAHGSTIDPMSRNYSCWKRWGSQFQSPRMVTEDPMCDQAWKADPNAMWNWNGTYRDGVGGNHQAAVPDGQLCSAGRTGGSRYAALDNPGPWVATPLANNFRVTVHDQARHGADYYRIYVTKQGFDPLTQRLGWGDLELVTETGRIAPGAGRAEADQVLNGVSVGIDARAPGRTGRHIVFTIWQASHSDQSYYLCSDVIFGQGGTPPTGEPTPTAPPTTRWTPPTTASPQPTTTAPPSSTPTTVPALPPGDRACTASYRVVSSWPNGFQAEVTVTAGSAGTNGWQVGGTLPAGHVIRQGWNATMSGAGSTLAAANVAWNGVLPAGGSTTFGFLGEGVASGVPPALTCAAR